MDTVLLPHAHASMHTHAVTSLPLKMFAVSPANPTSAVLLGKHQSLILPQTVGSASEDAERFWPI